MKTKCLQYLCTIMKQINDLQSDKFRMKHEMQRDVDIDDELLP